MKDRTVVNKKDRITLMVIIIVAFIFVYALNGFSWVFPVSIVSAQSKGANKKCQSILIYRSTLDAKHLVRFDEYHAHQQWIHSRCNREYPLDEGNALIHIQYLFGQYKIAYDRYMEYTGNPKYGTGLEASLEVRLHLLEEAEQAWSKLN